MESPLTVLTQEGEKVTFEKLFYDTKAGIGTFVDSLEHLHVLLDARRDARRRGERLHEFVVFGTWCLDEFGQVSRIVPGRSSVWPKQAFPDIPDVLANDEFYAFLRGHEAEGEHISISQILSGAAIIAPAGIPCIICGETWGLTNATDVFDIRTSRIEPLHDFVGQPFSEFKARLSERTDASYFIGGELQIRNDRHIDLTTNPRFPTLKINERGWIGRNGEVGPDYVVAAGDETLVNITTYSHGVCYASMMAARREAEFGLMFGLAGFESVSMMAVENCYGEAQYGGPWFEVTTEIGVITIGWRRRVISIDWGATGKNLLEIFEDVGGTKGPHYIHAMDASQVVDYLTRIREGMLKLSALAP